MDRQTILLLIQQLILPGTVILGRLLLSRLIKSVRRKNQSLEWLNIAEGVLAELRRLHPGERPDDLVDVAA